MKKSILTVLFALCSTIGFAQVSFQVKAGLNLSSYIGENSDHSKFKPGARIGDRYGIPVYRPYFSTAFSLLLTKRDQIL